MANQDKLKKVLLTLSTPEERARFEELNVQIDQNKNLEELNRLTEQKVKQLDGVIELLTQTLISNKEGQSKSTSILVDKFNGFIETIATKLEELKGTVSTSYEKNKPVNSAGVYKDMINQLSAINESVKNKPVPVWNWPQYASVGVRNKSFSNIDPATDGIGIGSYDYVALVQASLTDTYTFKTGGSGGTLVATIVILYTGSDKATISTVTKT